MRMAQFFAIELYFLTNIVILQIYFAMFKQSYGSFLKSKWFLEAAARESKSLKFRHSKLKAFHTFLKVNRILCL